MKALLTALAITVGLLAAPQAAHAKTWTTTCHLTPLPGAIKSTPKTYQRSDVWVYGDSITVQTRANMHLPWSAVDARSGRDTADAATHLVADLYAHQAPAYVVMATGTNDRKDPKLFRSKVRYVEAIAQRWGFTVYWVNVGVTTGSDPAALNDYLASRPAIRVLDWAALVKPSYLSDGIHVTSSGCTARNTLIEQALG